MCQTKTTFVAERLVLISLVTSSFLSRYFNPCEQHATPLHSTWCPGPGLLEFLHVLLPHVLCICFFIPLLYFFVYSCFLLLPIYWRMTRPLCLRLRFSSALKTESQDKVSHYPSMDASKALSPRPAIMIQQLLERHVLLHVCWQKLVYFYAGFGAYFQLGNVAEFWWSRSF